MRLVVVFLSSVGSSFTPPVGPLHDQGNKIFHLTATAARTTATRTAAAGSTTKLCLLGGLFGDGDRSSSSTDNGPPTVMEIPAKDVKIGALRFLLQIHLVGMQNEPQPNSWLTKQGEDGELNIYYGDGTGMLSLDLQEYGIRAVRYGEKPSLQYMLQESVLLHTILDELQTVAFDVEDIEKEKRLLRLSDDEAIDKARDKLPARKS